jgi:hypothetical protein
MVVDEGSPRKRWGQDYQSQQPPMFKSLLALTAMTLLGASVIALPAFAPKVEAREVAVLAKADRLQVRTPASNCGGQVWPNLEAACLRTAADGTKILEARLVDTRR